MVSLNANDYVRVVVYSTSTSIDLEAGSAGDTYFSIQDMIGGEAGPAGADAIIDSSYIDSLIQSYVIISTGGCTFGEIQTNINIPLNPQTPNGESSYYMEVIEDELSIICQI